MKKLLISVGILLIAAGGCKSSKKTVENYSSDSTVTEIVHSRMFKVESDSMIMNRNLGVDSIGVNIRYDSSGKICERVYSVKGLYSGVKKKSVSKGYVMENDSVMIKENESVKSNVEETAENEKKSVVNLWRIVSFTFLAISALIIYRVFRG